MKATSAIILDKRSKKKSHTFPVKLRVTYQRKSKLYGIEIDLSEDDWNKVHGSNLRDDDLKEIRNKFATTLSRSNNIIEEIASFSFEVFDKKFKLSSDQSNVYYAFDACIANLNEEERIGSAMVYTSAKIALKAFKDKLTFSDITADFLKSFERAWLETGRSITTVGIYIRCLRAIINAAIEEGIARRENYPFGKRKYIIPNSRNIKKAIDISIISKIFNYPAAEGSKEEKGKDFWIFSYLCNGINSKDICKLKWKDLRGDKIVFTRSKTKASTRANPKPIIIFMHEDALRIINKWATKEKEPNNYIFPFLVNVKNAREEQHRVSSVNSSWNKGLKIIGEQLGIKINFTMYSARHSFSTVMKRSGASTEFIAEALGHSNIQVTQSYLDSFEDSVKKEFSSMLTSFNKP